ncbi:MAG: long-chain fatty acid--CoA ligase [Deltaproteobacteria bacterium]|nr:long-chain fatty acid--CoA ligase [Deltaproteobacteria bacterium]
MNISSIVRRWCEINPAKTAIVAEGQKISYSELVKRVNRTACWLLSLGIEKGDRVAVMLKNSPEFMELYLACSRVGIIFVPINFRSAEAELKYFLENCEPRLFIFGSEFKDTVTKAGIKDTVPRLLLCTLGKTGNQGEFLDFNLEIGAFNGQRPDVEGSKGPSDPEEAHVIMYTSGTTGKPKGAVLSHRKTFFNCLNADIFFKLDFDDIMLIVLPLFHSGGLFIQATPTLYKGATMIIYPKFDPNRAREDIQKYRVTKFLGVPTVYKSLLQAWNAEKPIFSSLKICAIGGEKVTPEFMTQFREMGLPLRHVMGQTETSILLWASEDEVLRKPGSVGRPVFHSQVTILNKQGRPCKPGEIGEIVVRGTIMMNEYWRDPERTQGTIRNGWLHTGDLARMDEDGFYYLVDRAKDMYISGGENVYPAEVERVLREHPRIEDVAVVGVPDEKWGEVGHVFVICKGGCSLKSEDILSFCEGRLARFKWPKKFTFCKEFPRTDLGKVKKGLLREEAKGQ